RTLRGHADTINAVIFAPDGRLASCSWDRTIKFWDTATDQAVRRLAGRGAGQALPLVLAPGGARLAFGQSGTVNVFSGPVPTMALHDAATGRVAHTLRGHRGGTVQLAFSRGGTRLVSGGRSGDVTVWDAETGAEVCTCRGPEGEIVALALSPDARWAASA